LFNLQLFNQWRQIRVDFKGTLMKLHLRGYKICQIPEWLWGIQDILHNANRLFRTANKFVLSSFNLNTLFLTQMLIILMNRITSSLSAGEIESDSRARLGLALGGIERESSILDILAGLLRELDIGVERGVEGSVEVRDNALVLLETGFTDLFGGEGVLLESGCERVGGLEKVG
jgi:hypothetical protein